MDLLICYAIVKWTCLTQRQWLFDATTAGALLVVAIGAVLSWTALNATEQPRARFMAVLGLTSSALFALTVLAAWIPRWVLDACR
jgi:hypothetical protein